MGLLAVMPPSYMPPERQAAYQTRIVPVNLDSTLKAGNATLRIFNGEVLARPKVL